MENRNISKLQRMKFVDDNGQSKVSSDNSNERNVKFRSTSTDPVINLLRDSMPNFRDIAKESRNSEIPANLANLTEEFNDLTRKMARLKEALKNPPTGSGKKNNLINSSSQALQVSNLNDVLAAKRFIHDCIVELTFVDHFLDGNPEIAANYREKLENAMAGECARAKTFVMQGSSIVPNTFKLISPGKNFPLEVFSKPPMREVEIQTETLETIVIEIPSNKNGNDEPLCAIECFDDETNANVEKKKKWYSICCGCVGEKKSTQQTKVNQNNASSSKKSTNRNNSKPKKSPKKE